MFASSSRPLVRSLAQRSARTVRQASSGAAEKPALEKATAVVDGIVKHAVRGFNLVSEKAGLSAYKEPIVYNTAVARELLKQVYVAEGLAPPTLAQVASTYSNFFTSAQSMNYWKKLVESGEWKKYAIYAAEAYGIFKIGEMIGRRHIVGYGLVENKPAVVVA